MYVANRNLEFIRFKNAYCGDIFAKQSNPVKITIENIYNKNRYAFNVLLKATDGEPVVTKEIPEIPALNERFVELSWTPQKRGWQSLPRFQIESTYPFDMLRAWRNYLSSDKVLVFPEKKGNNSFPITSRSSQNAGQQGLFRDHREYSAGDQVRRIDWRASTKHQDLLVKVFENDESNSYEFSWGDTKHLTNFEARISQLALWIDLCERQNASYSLKIGSTQLKLNRGLNHYRECMQYLAELTSKDLS